MSPIEREPAGRRHERFVLRQDGHEAEITFVPTADGLWITDHTGVPEALGGRGVGSALARHVVAAATAEGVRLLPTCPFVRGWIERHPEHWAVVYSPQAAVEG